MNGFGQLARAGDRQTARPTRRPFAVNKRSPSTDLFATPGYSPAVGTLVAMLTYTRATTVAAVEGLETAQLDYQHDATANPIGAPLAHISAIEWAYVTGTLGGETPAPSEWAAWGPLMRLGPAAWVAARGQTLAEHIDRLAAVRERTLAGLRNVDDVWLAQRAELSWIPGAATNLWAWYHVMEDELSHRGQIRWLRTRLPAAAP